MWVQRILSPQLFSLVIYLSTEQARLGRPAPRNLLATITICWVFRLICVASKSKLSLNGPYESKLPKQLPQRHLQPVVAEAL